MVDHVSGGEKMAELLLFPVELHGEEADYGEGCQRAGLEGVNRVEDPHEGAAVVEGDEVVVEGDKEGVGKDG